MKLALVFGEESNLPFYYRKLAGNILDSKTIHHLLADLKFLKHPKVKLVMDRGCYSEGAINNLFRNHMKFLISVKMSLTFIRTELDAIYDTFRNFEVYNEDYGLYCRTVRTTWKYTQERPHMGDTIREPRRLYIHYPTFRSNTTNFKNNQPRQANLKLGYYIFKHLAKSF